MPGGVPVQPFCELYRDGGANWTCHAPVHRAGESCSWTLRDTVSVVDGGQVRQAQIFVAVWGASSYTFAEARWGQGLSTGSTRTSAPLSSATV